MIKWLGLGIVVAALDQASKAVVVNSLELGARVDVAPIFSWVRWHNEGAAFSFLDGVGSWVRYLFITLALGFIAFLIYELRRLPATERLMGFVYGLILGGAIGNMLDRIFRGHVVDFVLFHYEQSYFPAFNVADSALFLGAVLWIYVLWQEYKQERASVESNR